MPTTRKLAAIVFVDIVGYSATMGRDEGAGLRLLGELRKVLYPLVQRYNGTVLKELGDGALMSFDSALEAAHCAEMLQRSAKTVPHLRLRIGIHIGDVIAEGKDVFGSGVNIAAHVQPLAVPGGIVVTEDVWKQIRNQPALSFVSLGSRRIKGASTSMKVFALKGEGLVVPDLKQRTTSHPSFKAGLVVAGIFVLAVLSYFFVPEVRQFVTSEAPSIAVLYLKNLGPEADEPYSYGITQDLIADIAKTGVIRIAPAKDILELRNVDVPVGKIADQLRVQFVLTATLKRESDLFLMAARIVEATTGKILWADSVLSKTSEVEGKLAGAILSVPGVTAPAEVVQKITKPRTTNPEAYEFYLKAKYRFDRKTTNEDVVVARDLYEKALALDSTFVSARSGLRMTYELQNGFRQPPQVDELARDKADTIGSMGNVFYDQGDFSKALDYFGQSLKIQQEIGERRRESITLNNIGNVYQTLGDYSKALDYFTQDLQITRELRDRKGEAQTLNNIGNVYYRLGDYARASENLSRSIQISQELGERSIEGTTIGMFGMLHLEKQEYKSAIDSLRKAAGIFTQTGEKQNMILVTSWLTLAEGKSGNRLSAAGQARRIDEFLASETKPAEFIEIVWNMTQVYALLGSPEKSARYLEKAYDEVKANAEMISDRTLQASYLTNVATNREIIAAWEKKKPQ